MKNEYKIFDESSFYITMNLLEDASFVTFNMDYNKDKEEWSAIFYRPLKKDIEKIKEVKKILWFHKYSIPYCESKLILRSVHSVNYNYTPWQKKFLFDEIYLDGKCFNICFSEDFKILIKFHKKPQGILKDIDIINKKMNIWLSTTWYKKERKKTYYSIKDWGI